MSCCNVFDCRYFQGPILSYSEANLPFINSISILVFDGYIPLAWGARTSIWGPQTPTKATKRASLLAALEERFEMPSGISGIGAQWVSQFCWGYFTKIIWTHQTNIEKWRWWTCKVAVYVPRPWSKHQLSVFPCPFGDGYPPRIGFSIANPFRILLSIVMTSWYDCASESKNCGIWKHKLWSMWLVNVKPSLVGGLEHDWIMTFHILAMS